MYIQMMQTAGLSLIFAVMTYGGNMFICITGHSENTPDAWSYTDEISAEISNLLAAKPPKRSASRTRRTVIAAD